MKKQISSVSKRKWIVGGFLFFGGLALLTTGLATWIIGTTILTDRDDLGVSVDTAKNQSVSIQAELSDESLYLRENVSKNNADADQIIFTDSDEAADLTIKFSKITIECGIEYYQEHFCEYDSQTATYTPKPFQLSVDFDYDGGFMNGLSAEAKANLEDLTSNNIVNALSNKFAEERIYYDSTTSSTTDTYTYIDMVQNYISVNAADITKWEDVNNFKQLVITEKEFNFTWGTFFSYRNNADEIVNNGPSAFYNYLSSKNGSSWRTLSNLQKVEDEINLMNQAFTASTSGKTGFIAIGISLPTA